MKNKSQPLYKCDSETKKPKIILVHEPGFEIFDTESTTLTSGFGSHHCMTAYLK